MTIASHPTRNYCPVPQEHKSLKKRARDEIGIRPETPTAAESATARLLKNVVGSMVHSTLRRLLWLAQKLGTAVKTPAR